jgi:hypothetical protein
VPLFSEQGVTFQGSKKNIVFLTEKSNRFQTFISKHKSNFFDQNFRIVISLGLPDP